VFSRAKRFYCEKYLQNLRLIFFLFIYSVAVYITWRDDHVHGTVTIYIVWRNDYGMSVILAFIVAFETTFR